jgi:cation diffusion facilitator CzcD-associated flavoprotein CzcO
VGTPVQHERTTRVDATFDVVVVGAGFSGLYMLLRARELGYRTHVYEAGPAVGGTWYWNRYPGARCDSESLYYSFSFSKELEQEWPLLERYPAQQTTLEYLNHVTDRFDLRRDISFNTKVTEAAWDEAARCWRIRTSTGALVRARFLVTAVGCLSAANKPEFDGLATFKGAVHHTSEWPESGLDLSGKRVGVIGTGSTGIQVIPEIAKEASHLTVFQRTPQYALPANNYDLSTELVQEVKDNYGDIRQQCRYSAAGTPYIRGERSALEVPEHERNEAYEEAWARGGGQFLGTYKDIFTDEAANETAAEFVRKKIRSIVKDPDVAESLMPRSYPIGTKRIPLQSGYYDAFNRDNVRLVDLRKTPMMGFTERGVRTSEEEIELDVVVFATGFDAITGPLLKLDLVGRNGVTLRERWANGPTTYLGLAVSDFPNLFMITGPGSPSVLTNMPMAIEQHVEWVADCLHHLTGAGIATIECTPEAEVRWTEHVAEVASLTLYPRAASWYVGANIAGKPRGFMPYVGGLGQYRRICERVAADTYRGFRIPGQERSEIDDFASLALPAAAGVPEA